MESLFCKKPLWALSCVVLLSGCGLGTSFQPPAADMISTIPPDPVSRRHNLPPGVTAGRIIPPMPMPPGAGVELAGNGAPPVNAPDRPSSPGGMSFGTDDGSGQTADITPRSAVPDTEVSYGHRGASVSAPGQ
ncbi:hypothetical protein D5366_03290 [Neokomagataea tanensis]|uniref:Lipoprotein n=2 Tax=Acetobacteraceae TaxID=433 RepID=A0A4Y6V736_9PROT|nr:hypothetical protein D5366_03290 [Neokomagataea tanensis]